MQFDRTLASVPRIGLREAKAQLDRGQAVFVDVRPVDKYEESHIPGALSIPLAEISRRIGELPTDKEIVLY